MKTRISTQHAGKTFTYEGQTFTITGTDKKYVYASSVERATQFYIEDFSNANPELGIAVPYTSTKKYAIACVKNSLIGYAAAGNFAFVSEFVRIMKEEGDITCLAFQVASTVSRYHRMSEKQAYVVARGIVENEVEIFGL